MLLSKSAPRLPSAWTLANAKHPILSKQAEQPRDSGSVLAQLYQAQAEVNASKAKSRSGKVKALKATAALFNFLQQNGISSMEQLYQKVEAMNRDYYDLRGQIVNAERRISALTERLEIFILKFRNTHIFVTVKL